MASILLQHVDGSVEILPVTAGSTLRKVLLSQAPRSPLSVDGQHSAKAAFAIVPSTSDRRVRPFLVMEKEFGAGKRTVSVKAVNYDDRYYLNDGDTASEGAVEDSYPWSEPAVPSFLWSYLYQDGLDPMSDSVLINAGFRYKINFESNWDPAAGNYLNLTIDGHLCPVVNVWDSIALAAAPDWITNGPSNSSPYTHSIAGFVRGAAGYPQAFKIGRVVSDLVINDAPIVTGFSKSGSGSSSIFTLTGRGFSLYNDLAYVRIQRVLNSSINDSGTCHFISRTDTTVVAAFDSGKPNFPLTIGDQYLFTLDSFNIPPGAKPWIDPVNSAAPCGVQRYFTW